VRFDAHPLAGERLGAGLPFGSGRSGSYPDGCRLLPPGTEARNQQSIRARRQTESAGQDARLYGRQDARRHGKEMQIWSAGAIER